MSFDVIRSAIESTTPDLRGRIDWSNINAALVILFTDRNLTDLHIEVRRERYPRNTSHKTHIDITSGKDIPQGESPVVDFFRSGSSSYTYPSRMSRLNLSSLGATSIPSGRESWIPAAIRVKILSPRNVSRNPSAQLTDKNDIQPLRECLDVGQSLILLRRSDGSYDVLGVNTTEELLWTIPRGKTKRMFLPDTPVQEPPVLVIADVEQVEEGGEGGEGGAVIPGQRALVGGGRVGGQGRLQDREVQNAIENRAMLVVRQEFERLGFFVKNVHLSHMALAAGLAGNPGYDLLATRGDEVKRLEVKGTTNVGSNVTLSINELEAAIALTDEVCLAVVSSIVVDYSTIPPTANGGELRLFRWLNVEGIKNELIELSNAAAKLFEVGVGIQKSSIKWTVFTSSQHLEVLDLTSLAV